MSDPAVAHRQEPCAKCGYLADSSAGHVNFCPKCGSDLRADDDDDDRTLTHSLVGQVIADRYRLIALLGEGGMGAVYKAEHIRMGKALAVKVLRGVVAGEEGAVARFRAEAQIVSRLSQPHTIAVFDFGEMDGGDGGFYLAMEYVPGKDLATVLREQRQLPESRAISIGSQLLGSLAEAHDAGIVHRDVKPGNVMLMEIRQGGDFVKVLDFGIAKLRDQAGPSTSETSVGAIVGTPNYLSPEQARGEVLDARSDLYSVGAVLYELVAGHPPFVAPNSVAVVSAHLTERPRPLAQEAPGVSPAFAAVIHRALEKRPQDRFQSADEMRAALLAVGDLVPRVTPATGIAIPDVTGDLAIASRKDFADFERQIEALRRSRVAGPAAVGATILLAALLAWRWGDVYAFLRQQAPGLAEALPAAFRPADLFDGLEHEPNDTPAQANPLPIPPGPDGRRGGGVAAIRGHIGAKLTDTTGDVDVFRIEVPAVDRPRVLRAEWSGEREGEGIRGLDVALTLNRDRGGEGRRSAPLVASVDRAGPGRPEELAAGVAPGVYYLAVREKHPEDAPPAEKPTDWYQLKVWLAEPQPGEEVEPNDAPDPVTHRELRYPEWKAVGERNPLGEGRAIHGTTSPEDPDTYSIAPRGAADTLELLALVPEARLALTAQLWVPDEVDLAPPRPRDRVRFEKAGEGAPGQVLFVRLPPAPRHDAAWLVQVRALSGEGRYAAVALGPGSASGAALVRLLEELPRDGRGPQALELAAGYVTLVPGSTVRTDVLVAAGKLAEKLAPTGRADLVPVTARASQLLGDAIFETQNGKVRYFGSFEAQVEGQGKLAEEASFRLITRATPCGPAEVERRASYFLERFPDSRFAAEARLWQARALEDAFWSKGSKATLQRALEAYRGAARGKGEVAKEARQRLQKLGGRKPQRPAGPRVVCK
ncbi:MAG TPA: serine/threonine-protein kinase [Anaeromyxobacteraceae bacterium]|nr:serine/threonine-protein kinase [Anaeromyxobacteraceae bacterium]